MNPYFFGSSARRLFGIYTPAQSSSDGRAARAVVLCNPWGAEYQYAHRSLRHLAIALSTTGMDVLRFDFSGTGDSAGESNEVSLRDWASDVETAIEELQDATGATRVALVGLRLGGILAAEIAAKAQQVDRLVLWDPIVNGEAYLRELEQTSGTSATETSEPAIWESQGFPMTSEFSRQLIRADPGASLTTFQGRTLVIRSSNSPVAQQWQQIQATRPPDAFVIDTVESPPVWYPEHGLGVGAIPIELIQRIAGWLQS